MTEEYDWFVRRPNAAGQGHTEKEGLREARLCMALTRSRLTQGDVSFFLSHGQLHSLAQVLTDAGLPALEAQQQALAWRSARSSLAQLPTGASTADPRGEPVVVCEVCDDEREHAGARHSELVGEGPARHASQLLAAPCFSPTSVPHRPGQYLNLWSSSEDESSDEEEGDIDRAETTPVDEANDPPAAPPSGEGGPAVQTRGDLSSPLALPKGDAPACRAACV